MRCIISCITWWSPCMGPMPSLPFEPPRSRRQERGQGRAKPNFARLISNDLYAKMTAFVEPVRSHAHDEGDADVPNGESAGHHQCEALAFVSRNVAGTERELRAG